MDSVSQKLLGPVGVVRVVCGTKQDHHILIDRGSLRGTARATTASHISIMISDNAVIEVILDAAAANVLNL